MGTEFVRVCFNLPQRHQAEIRSLQSQTGLGMSELVRRMLDLSLQKDSLNQIVPTMSGQLYTGGK